MTLNDVLRKKNLMDKGFDIKDGWTVALKETTNGLIAKPLANFIAWPTKEVEFDDGQDMSRYFDIAGILADGKLLPSVRITHAEFLGSLPAVLSKHWGMDIIIKPRAKDELRETMQILGRRRKKETVYTHTGWRNINNKWIFLHTGGAVGANDTTVDLKEGGENLQRYVLPKQCNDQQRAVKATFSLLTLAAANISYPLFAVAFLAPLTQLLSPVSLGADFILFLVSRTQSGKSTLAAIYQSFFGDFDKNHFPANYRMTASSLERMSFLLKDVLMVVDDYYPAQSHSEKESQKQLAQLLARAYGDGVARSRMGGNGKLRQSWAPRGVAISTGEERPDIGESGQARFVFMDIDRADIKYDEVEQFQQTEKKYLAEFMVMYLEWVSANWDRISPMYQNAYQQGKEMLKDERYSGRINESLAKLCGSLEVLLTFAKEQEYIDDDEYLRHGELAFEAFKELLERNVDSLVSEKPAQKFMATLSDIILTGQGQLCLINEQTIPEHHLGCYDDQYVYLFPYKCYQAVQRYCRAQGQQFPIGDKMLWRHLKAENIIEVSDFRGPSTIQKRLPCLENKNINVLKINKIHLGIE